MNAIRTKELFQIPLHPEHTAWSTCTPKGVPATSTTTKMIWYSERLFRIIFLIADGRICRNTWLQSGKKVSGLVLLFLCQLATVSFQYF